MNITQEESESKGRLVAVENDQELGEMTYSVAGKDLIIVDHTGIQKEQEGKGIGRALFIHLVEMVRKDGRKVMPLCPFTRMMFEKHRDKWDVLRHGSL